MKKGTVILLPAAVGACRFRPDGSITLLEIAMRSTMKKLAVFDLDGTLAESKSPLDPEMADLIDRLLNVVKVAVISGGSWPNTNNRYCPIFRVTITFVTSPCFPHVVQNSTDTTENGKNYIRKI